MFTMRSSSPRAAQVVRRMVALLLCGMFATSIAAPPASPGYGGIQLKLVGAPSYPPPPPPSPPSPPQASSAVAPPLALIPAAILSPLSSPPPVYPGSQPEILAAPPSPKAQLLGSSPPFFLDASTLQRPPSLALPPSQPSVGSNSSPPGYDGSSVPPTSNLIRNVTNATVVLRSQTSSGARVAAAPTIAVLVCVLLGLIATSQAAYAL
ncbi:hypothetical protein VOLCADRAFT_94100 [Volvox carteri f. nagariensis]|uniref:Uncharacterized protein n=1 Tax=Volvox carteri f. nagariensis TaxID=3068 RepID=D8U3X0_VOLCA|nr:uncharacterized protein VOLCADRAFT_94100 [Volvox carteri f. nagariensis]EFJ45605.1 hypothetical protein VOLCADRAFT_94100 [Volvox carteri f. nagariensis]|eukprot:XP_002953295.1 hypothetical protein VOLCADRAFT_94100 [Volvox carteri f. nagariensis]